ncbi:MAG: molybdate ABC transporter substrate-binding protein [bacterium]
MKTAATVIALCVTSALSAPGCDDTGPGHGELTVFAAASLADVADDLADLYRRESGVPVHLNTASSSTLARQIDQGARADAFLSANAEWMDYIKERGEVRPGTRTAFLGNRLVLIAPAGEPVEVEVTREFDIAGAFDGRLALGDPGHVPAGIYTRAALESLGWYEPLESRLLPCQHVRAALAMVELGEAKLAVVYATDAAMSDAVTVVGTFPASTHPPIRYVAAVCEGARPGAERFVRFLRGQPAAEVFERYGFVPLSQRKVGNGVGDS